MVVTASQMATSQFHSVPDRRRPATNAQHPSLSPGRQASQCAGGLGGPAGSVVGLNANQSVAYVCLLSSPADLALSCQPNNGPIPMDGQTVGGTAAAAAAEAIVLRASTAMIYRQ